MVTNILYRLYMMALYLQIHIIQLFNKQNLIVSNIKQKEEVEDLNQYKEINKSNHNKITQDNNNKYYYSHSHYFLQHIIHPMMQSNKLHFNNNNKLNQKSKEELPKKIDYEDNNKQSNIPKKQKAQRQISISITPYQYTSLHVKHLGNHSLWKRTTFQTRFNDDRLQFINPNYFINKHVLDIGCNEGFLDIEIAMRFFPKQIYAIDIDHKLIKNAKKTLFNIIKKDVNYQALIDEQQKLKQSVQKNGEQKHTVKNAQLDISNLSLNDKQEQNKKQILCKKIQDLPLFFQDRLKTSFSIDHYLPNNVKVFAQEMFKPQNRFPLNIKFQADNIYTIKYQEDKLYYDTILCLKVTKWIHLTFGDDGIRRLFQKIYDLLRLDGILILQAQDWASYKRKKNMHQTYRENYERIHYGPNDFQSLLVNDPLKDFKFQLVQKIDQNQRTNKTNKKLDYPILVFKKKSTMLYY